jgi:alkylated DNA repair protein (DNA oxidative demethylase)
MAQESLFDQPDVPPDFLYRPDFVTADEEDALLRDISRLEFSRVEMRGGIARRRTAHFGWTYGYDARTTTPGVPLPAFLLPVRERSAVWAGVEAEALAEALVTEYPDGAPIGWHRDAPMFGIVIGISLGAPCRMKFRPYVSPRDAGGSRRAPRRAAHELELAPRSAYLIRGVARRDYEHSIPPVEGTRYSITFRTLKGRTTFGV